MRSLVNFSTARKFIGRDDGIESQALPAIFHAQARSSLCIYIRVELSADYIIGFKKQPVISALLIFFRKSVGESSHPLPPFLAPWRLLSDASILPS